MTQLVTLYIQGVNVDSYIPIAWQDEIRIYLSQFNLQTFLSNPSLQTVLKKITPQFIEIANSSLSFLLGLTITFLVFLYTIFILLDYENLNLGWLNIIPNKYKGIIKDITQDIEIGMNRYFRGQALVAIIVGVLFAIGFSIINLPMAILFGLFVGLLNLVPYLQTISLAPALLLVFMKSLENASSFGSELIGLIIVYILIQLFQDMFLVPKIMGKVTGMKPAVILLSLSIWGSLMGVVGLIIALPLTTLIISYYKRLVLEDDFSLSQYNIKEKSSTNQHNEETKLSEDVDL